MSTLELLAWIIGFGNPIAATLHGPALALWLRRSGRARFIEPAQGAAWGVLFATQVVFLVFGVISALGGFRWAQGLMIPVAALNFWVWWKVRSPRDQGCRCQECGRRYRVDINIPDSLWATIGMPPRAGLLCGACIIGRLELLGYGAFHLAPRDLGHVYANGRHLGDTKGMRFTHANRNGEPVGREQCSEPVYSHQASPPERCAFDAGHDGEHQP